MSKNIALSNLYHPFTTLDQDARAGKQIRAERKALRLMAEVDSSLSLEPTTADDSGPPDPPPPPEEK